MPLVPPITRSDRSRARRGLLLVLAAVSATTVGIALLPSAAVGAAAPLFSDGFESGSLSSWTHASGLSLEQQNVHTGAWAATATSTGAGKTDAYKKLTSPVGEVYLRTWFDLVGRSTPVTLLRTRTAAGAPLASVNVNKKGMLALTNSVTKVTTGSSVAIARGSWRSVELHVAIAGTTSRVDVWLDGTRVAALSHQVSLGTAPVGRIEIGESGTGRIYSVAFDDVVAGAQPVDTAAPTTPTGLHATVGGAGVIDLSWNASSDDSAVAGYTVYRFDGTAYTSIGTTSGTSFANQGLAPSTTYSYEVDAFDLAGNHAPPAGPAAATTSGGSPTPIQHVVVIDLENHSFDSLLGRLCAQIAVGTITGHQPCDGATTATLSTAQVIPIRTSPDVVPAADHTVNSQSVAVDGGRMDGFDLIWNCTSATDYPCITQYDPSQEPNMAALAERFVISDRTFEFTNTPSWAGHIVLAAASTDGFNGDNPTTSTFTTKTGPGWGCDSYKDAPWWNGSAFVLVPSCVPDRNGAGPYRSSPVPYVPTIFDRLDAAGLTWKIYGGVGKPGTESGYGWTICPTFYECLGSSQRANLVPSANVIPAGQAGTLPSFSIVTPTGANSEHNGYSMAVGDNWLGQVVGAIEHGPDWPSTAIFITWDDCGCFYDHVPPAFPGEGIRVPLLIVSPYARLGMTDSTDATYASILAYVEHDFGLAPLSGADAAAYDYANAFDYFQTPVTAPVRMVHTKVPAWELRRIAAHHPDANDPT